MSSLEDLLLSLSIRCSVESTKSPKEFISKKPKLERVTLIYLKDIKTDSVNGLRNRVKIKLISIKQE